MLVSTSGTEQPSYLSKSDTHTHMQMTEALNRPLQLLGTPVIMIPAKGIGS